MNELEAMARGYETGYRLAMVVAVATPSLSDNEIAVEVCERDGAARRAAGAAARAHDDGLSAGIDAALDHRNGYLRIGDR